MARLRDSGWLPNEFHDVIPGEHMAMILYLQRKKNHRNIIVKERFVKLHRNGIYREKGENLYM